MFDLEALYALLGRKKQLRYGGRADQPQQPTQDPMQHYDTGEDYARMGSELRHSGLPPQMSYASAQGPQYDVEVGEPQMSPQYSVEVGEPVMDAGSQMRDVNDYAPTYEEGLYAQANPMALRALRKQRRGF